MKPNNIFWIISLILMTAIIIGFAVIFNGVIMKERKLEAWILRFEKANNICINRDWKQ